MIMKLAAAWLFGSLGKTINFRLVEQHGVMSSDNLLVRVQPRDLCEYVYIRLSVLVSNIGLLNAIIKPLFFFANHLRMKRHLLIITSQHRII